MAADEDLKLADLLKYYLRESQAAKVIHSADSYLYFNLIHRKSIHEQYLYLSESQCDNWNLVSLIQDLLYRRGRALVDYENANKALDKARAKNRDVLQAETSQQVCCQKFEKISESAKQGSSPVMLYILGWLNAVF